MARRGRGDYGRKNNDSEGKLCNIRLDNIKLGGEFLTMEVRDKDTIIAGRFIKQGEYVLVSEE